MKCEAVKDLKIGYSGIACLLLTLLVLAGMGCGGTSPGVGFPSIIGDGSGGVFAAYEVLVKDDARDCYLQRISAQGEKLWGKRGVHIGRGYHSPGFFRIVADENRGVLVAWNAYPAPVEGGASANAPARRVTTVTRVDAEGNILWQQQVQSADTQNIDRLEELVSDGAGGAILAHSDSRLRSLALHRLDEQGNQKWTEDGIQREYSLYSLTGDGAGGAVFVWQQLNAETGQPEKGAPILAQSIGPEGANLWPVDVQLVPADRGPVLDDGAGDGSGGMIVTWVDHTGAPGTVWGQRLDSSGRPLWGEDGMPVFSETGQLPGPASATSSSRQTVTTTTGSMLSTEKTALKGDEKGGALLLVNSLSLRAQAIALSGETPWGSSGVAVRQGPAHAARIAGYSLRGSTIAWSETFGLPGAQRLNDAGDMLWGPGGVEVTSLKDANFFNIIVADAGNGAALVSWGRGKDRYNIQKSYVQLLDAQGNRLWGDGIRLGP